MKKWILSLAALCLPLFAHANDYLFFSPQMTASHIKDYTEEEKALIEKDLDVVRSVCVRQQPPHPDRKPFYLGTAGSPGARKSTILERFLKTHPAYALGDYLDPDQRGLKFMPHTYYNLSLSNIEVAESENYALARKKAYEKWRGASNYITLKLLEESFAQKRDVVHGTTMTGEHVPAFFNKLKEAGYDIVLLFCYSEDNFCFKSIDYRNNEQKFYQCTPEDALSKAKFFPQRIPSLLSLADTVYFYWSDDLSTREQLAATLEHGELKIQNQEAYNKFVNKYERDRATLSTEGKSLPEWNTIIK